MNSESLASIIIVCFFGLIFIIGFVFYIVRRNYHPLDQRSLPLVTLVHLCSLLFLFINIFSYYAGNTPCIFFQFLSFAIYVAYSQAIQLSAYRTYFKYMLSQDTAQYFGKNTLLEASEKSWFVRNSNLFTDKLFLESVLVHLIVFSVIFIIIIESAFSGVWYQYPTTSGVCSPSELSVLSYSILFIYTLIISIFLVFKFQKIKKVQDGLHFKREIKITAVIWSCGFIAWFLTTKFGYSILGAIIIYFAWGTSYLCTVGICIVETYKFDYESQKKTDDTNSWNASVEIPEIKESSDQSFELKKLNLKEVLSDTEMRSRFKEFLIGEWSVENLLFWEDVDRLRGIVSSEEIAKECIRLYDIYIDSASLFQVNLPHKFVQEIINTIEIARKQPELCSSSSYFKAQEKVFVQLNEDSFVRFKNQWNRKGSVA